jgi:hypothetical protein
VEQALVTGDYGPLVGEFSSHVEAIDLVQTRLGITVDEDRQQVDVAVHHPRFPEMTDGAKATVSFLVLDWLLGEDGVERWVGDVQASDVEPPASLPTDALDEVLVALRQRHPNPSWAILEGEDATGSPSWS